MNKLFVRNDAKYRLLRTIIQGVIGVLIANLDYIFGLFEFAPETKVILVALTMAILSPIMASMGVTQMDKPELPDDYYEGGDDDGDSA